MINNADWVEGIYVRFRDVSAGSLTYNLITVLNTDATSYTVPNLQKFTKYDFFLVPFFKSVEGQPSNSMAVQTSEDGMCIRYLFKILVYEFLTFVVLFYFSSSISSSWICTNWHCKWDYSICQMVTSESAAIKWSFTRI